MNYRSIAKFRLDRIRGHSLVPILSANSIVIDAGAHRGEFSGEVYRKYGAKCILIEANPTLSQQLKPPCTGELIQAALGASDGVVSFYFRENPEAGSIEQEENNNHTDQVSVPLVSLDRILSDRGIECLDLLKLDIEGAEFEVIENLSPKSLKNIAQITVEFHDFLPQYSKGRRYQRAREKLTQTGFLCCPMSFRTHGDVLFINKDLIQVTWLESIYLRHFARWWNKVKQYIGRPSASTTN